MHLLEGEEGGVIRHPRLATVHWPEADRRLRFASKARGLELRTPALHPNQRPLQSCHRRLIRFSSNSEETASAHG
jgi:hypothetical protein